VFAIGRLNARSIRASVNTELGGCVTISQHINDVMREVQSPTLFEQENAMTLMASVHDVCLAIFEEKLSLEYTL